MYKTLTCLITAVVLLALAGSASAELVGHWRLDETGGTTALDASGNGNDGAIQGDPVWVAGAIGGAMECDGDDYVDCDNILELTDGLTIMAWVNPTDLSGDHGFAARSAAYAIKSSSDHLRFTTPGILDYDGNATILENGAWQHVAATFVPNQDEGLIFYLNGVESERLDTTGLNAGTGPFLIANNQWSQFLIGAIDDVRVYDHILTTEEIADAMLGGDPELASGPNPEDEATDIPRDVVLAWEPGEFAVTHDVYLGTVFDDVNDASRSNAMGLLVSQGQNATAYAPETVLEFGQTYYWRVDEVNGAPDNTVFKGQVWSFTVEPFAYAITNITATSNGTSEAGAGPENTINGSGLNADDEHSTESGDMWLARSGDDSLWIQFEFDSVYKLHEMLVWNYNVQFELLLGFGIKNVTVEYSEDGVTWMSLGDVELAQATARPDYTANTMVDLGGVGAKYVRLAVNDSFGTIGQQGLSEVRFTYVPVQAREPQPADGAVDVSAQSMLAWRAGREATSHEVSLGTDPNALALAATVAAPEYDPGALDLATTYYWQITEVNEAEAVSAWAGRIWSFATEEYAVVDDFESYNDEDNVIYETWIDGWVNETGSTVGYLTEPFAETTVVRSGSQAMPLFYDNLGVATAEVELELAQDWTASNIQSLSLYFRGAEDNTAGQLYVEINGTRVDYDGPAEDLTIAVWQPWNIDLSSIGANLSNVTSLTIGIEGSGASGVLYIDDIRLYPRKPEYVTPAEPDAANLMAYYALDGNVNDGSGNGYNGVEVGSPTYGAGQEGQAIQLDGVEDYVEIADVGISGAAARTIAGWAKADQTDLFAWTDVFGFTGPSTNGGHFDIQAVGGGTYTTLGYYGLHCYGWERDLIPIDLEWHHLAATYDGTAASWYADGRRIGTADIAVDTPETVNIGKRQDNTNLFPGMVDELRIYNVALSEEEIAWLAGRTASLHKGF